MGNVDLRFGDCHALIPSIQPNSIDAIITDPLYSEINTYAWLESLPCLNSRGNGVAFVNAKWLNCVLRKMRTELPTFTYLNPSGAGLNGKIITKTHHVVWWGSGHLVGYIPDGWLSTSWSAPYLHQHKWAKNPKYIRLLITALTNVGDTILDPFMGSGLVGVECVKLDRNYIGMEIDADSFAIAQRLIRDAQKQMVMF